MRILLYGMQSSGATLAAALLGQMPHAVVVADLFHDARMPALGDLEPRARRVVGKCVVTTRYTLDDHAARFAPDRTILVLRQPGSTYVSLARKRYGDWSGTMAEKFRRLEAVYEARDQFDAVLRYEDLVLRPAAAIDTLRDADIEVAPAHFDLPRSRLDLLKGNAEMSPWCRTHYRVDWGLGNLRGDAIEPRQVFKYVPPGVEDRVRTLCPTVQAHYDAYTPPLWGRLASRRRTRPGAPTVVARRPPALPRPCVPCPFPRLMGPTTDRCPTRSCPSSSRPTTALAS